MVHGSKKDLWLVGLMILAPLTLITIGVLALAMPNGHKLAGLIPLLIGITVGAVILLLTYPLSYEIAPPFLIIRCGMVRTEIPLANISRVVTTRNPASAPAWSLDRLQITYMPRDGSGSALISPTDKMQFMRDLVASTQGLRLMGDRIERTPNP